MGRKSASGFTGLLIGGAIGSAIAFLFAPKSGEKLRKDIKSNMDQYVDKIKIGKDKLITDAKSLANDINKKADKLRDLNKKYSSGSFEGPMKKLEKEIISLRTGLYTAISRYKEHSDKEPELEKVVDDIYVEFEEDKLPAKEGMGKRYN